MAPLWLGRKSGKEGGPSCQGACKVDFGMAEMGSTQRSPSDSCSAEQSRAASPSPTPARPLGWGALMMAVGLHCTPSLPLSLRSRPHLAVSPTSFSTHHRFPPSVARHRHRCRSSVSVPHSTLPIPRLSLRAILHPSPHHITPSESQLSPSPPALPLTLLRPLPSRTKHLLDISPPSSRQIPVHAAGSARTLCRISHSRQPLQLSYQLFNPPIHRVTALPRLCMLPRRTSCA